MVTALCLSATSPIQANVQPGLHLLLEGGDFNSKTTCALPSSLITHDGIRISFFSKLQPSKLPLVAQPSHECTSRKSATCHSALLRQAECVVNHVKTISLFTLCHVF